MTTLDNAKLAKNSIGYRCEICDYITCRKYNYKIHLNSKKHRSITETTQNNAKLAILSNRYFCTNCDKGFNDRAGLWRHKKKCIIDNDVVQLIPTDVQGQTELINYLLKENAEFKQLMMEQNKQMIVLAQNAGSNNNSYINNHTNNSHNKQFNLNFYLNETCKNAMNINDFINQLEVTIEDLEETGRIGYAEGISKIFVNGLKQVQVNDRPIHCSDLKRETVYIKDNNEWNKDNEDKSMLTHAIKEVANKNIKQISEWTKANPEFNDPHSKVNDKYLKIVCESMSGSSEKESLKNYSKIIKKVVKETVIDKEGEEEVIKYN